MELINLRYNKNSLNTRTKIDSVLLYGNPDEISNVLITICIPTFKRYSLLKESIDSSLNQLHTKAEYQVVVVDNDDDFSREEILHLIKSYNNKRLIYYKNKKNIGMVANWNRCIELGNTKWVSLLHDDDLLKDTYIAEVEKLLERYKKKIDCITFPRQFEGDYIKTIVRSKAFYRTKNIYKKIQSFFFANKIVKYSFASNIFNNNIYGPPTCGILFNRFSFLSSGGFNADYYPSSDWFFMIYFDLNFNVYRFNKRLAIYRWLDNCSFKDDTVELFRVRRNLCIKSLSETFLISKLQYNILKKDFKIIMQSTIKDDIEGSLSFRFKLLKLISLFKLT